MTVSENHIAIIDDDPDVCRALARLLRSSSYAVRTYSSASEFIDSLEVQVPYCLLTDLHMPEMSGEELLHFLADTGFRIPTIILTAHDQDGTQERCRQAGAKAFLVKPVSADQLLGTIEQTLLTSGEEWLCPFAPESNAQSPAERPASERPLLLRKTGTSR